MEAVIVFLLLSVSAQEKGENSRMMTAPEVGQTVLVRGSPYIVEGCTEQALPETTQQNQHLVTFSCLDENSLDEKLQVIWELEPGAEMREASSLPDVRAFDDPGDLDAFLHAVRWGIISQMDHSNMQSPFRSGIEPEDYQLEPVARALTMQEPMLRNRAATVLIVCPASLQYLWRDEMRDKFGLEFRIINSESVSHLRRQRGIHVNPWTHFPRLITSIDYFKQDRVFQRFCEPLPAEGTGSWPRRYDLLIVDEAHNISPAGSLHYAKPSLRTRIIRRIVPHFEHRLFLTATPHNGYSESFSALLEILDPQRSIRGVTPTADMLRQVMVRHMKSDIVAFDGTPRFPRREIHPLEVAYSEEERTVHRLFQRYADLCTARLRDAGGVPWLAMRFVLILLKKRLFSSPRAFASTLEKHAASRSRARTAPRRPRQAQWHLPDFEEMTDNEAAEALDNATATLPCPDTEEEQALTELRGWAQRSMQRRDSKAEHLLDWLQQTLCPGGVWNRTRVVIFTEYMDTQHYLAELLSKSGMGGERLICLNGATSAQERERFKAAFQADPDTSPVRILLGTDAASEGINLQNHCSRLIHYEIPWNPSRLEQRNGRVDRHGQHAPVVDIYHFVAADLAQGQHDVMVADLEFLYRVVNKVETIRQDLGKVGPVIAEQVEQAMLAGGNRRRELVTSRAERDAEAARTLLKLDRDLKRILQDIHSRMDATRNELLLTPEHVRHTVEVALRLANQPPLTPVDVPRLPAGRAFRLPAFNGAWAACLEGNAHPYTLQPRPVVFSGDDAAGRDDVVLAHLNHRLVSMSLRLLRAQLWASALHRRRFFSLAEAQTLPCLLEKSADAQQSVTDKLGLQVRGAITEFLRALDRLDRNARAGSLLSGIPAPQLYEAALTVMMRVVFLLSAEERGLLRLGEPAYDQAYAASTLCGSLREQADKQGEEVLGYRHDAWVRLLSLFRAVYGGIRHESLRLPAYGGSLFDPDAYPFLEGRPQGSCWRDTPARPLPVDNRVILHMLESLQFLRDRQTTGRDEAGRLSFRGLDVEQIGHVYEGLLDRTAARAEGVLLGLAGKSGAELFLSLDEAEAWLAQGEAHLLARLRDLTGSTQASLKKQLLGERPRGRGRGRGQAALSTESDAQDEAARREVGLHMACNGDTALLEHVRPFADLLRQDSFGLPVIVPDRGLYVTSGSQRRDTGTHYTPPSLTEMLVAATLEPHVYHGPAEGLPREQWRLHDAERLLSLKVCDMAMGSGAFLVQACRYLADRLLAAWATPASSSPNEPLPEDAEERLALARRLVADRCLYGVDNYPMAVEMAKLSLWLVTLQKDRPFSFLDHALRCGDALIMAVLGARGRRGSRRSPAQGSFQ